MSHNQAGNVTEDTEDLCNSTYILIPSQKDNKKKAPPTGIQQPSDYLRPVKACPYETPQSAKN